ncbi:hypothetical protein [Salipaludibacillus agaradhaerens]|nr:hypothetical protein [Salipaludibacillus agaradhaerens]
MGKNILKVCLMGLAITFGTLTISFTDHPHEASEYKASDLPHVH